MKELIQHRGCLGTKKVEGGERRQMSARLLKISAALNIFKGSSRFHQGESKRPKSTLRFRVTEEPHIYTRDSTRKLGLFYINELPIHFANKTAQTSLSIVKKGAPRRD